MTNYFITRNDTQPIASSECVHLQSYYMNTISNMVETTGMNITTTDPPCTEWFKTLYPDANGNTICGPILDAVPGWRALWQSIAWVTVVLQVGMLLWTSHDIFRLWLSYKQRIVNKFWTNPLLHGQVISFIGSGMMALSYIDPWGFFGWYDPTLYLSFYALPYGLIAAHCCVIAIYILDVVVWKAVKRDLDARSGMRIGTIVLIGLIVLYAAVGFPIFGWVLADKFHKNHNTPLGAKGNILAYTMYGLVMLTSFITLIGSAVVFRIHEKAATAKGRETLAVARGRTTKWCVNNFVACALFLGTQIYYQYRSGDTNLTGTFFLLGCNRILEVFLQFNTNQFQDAAYIDAGYIPHYMNVIFHDSNSVRERGNTTSGSKGTNGTRMSRVGTTTAVTKDIDSTTSTAGDSQV